MKMEAALLILILVDRLDFNIEHDVERVLIHWSGSVVIPEWLRCLIEGPHFAEPGPGNLTYYLWRCRCLVIRIDKYFRLPILILASRVWQSLAVLPYHWKSVGADWIETLSNLDQSYKIKIRKAKWTLLRGSLSSRVTFPIRCERWFITSTLCTGPRISLVHWDRLHRGINHQSSAMIEQIDQTTQSPVNYEVFLLIYW